MLDEFGQRNSLHLRASLEARAAALSSGSQVDLRGIPIRPAHHGNDLAVVVQRQQSAEWHERVGWVQRVGDGLIGQPLEVWIQGGVDPQALGEVLALGEDDVELTANCGDKILRANIVTRYFSQANNGCWWRNQVRPGVGLSFGLLLSGDIAVLHHLAKRDISPPVAFTNVLPGVTVAGVLQQAGHVGSLWHC